jgi:hypothetical protein
MAFFDARGRDTDAPTRREVLRGMFSTGLVATAGAGVSGLLGAPAARAAGMQMPATMILNGLPPDAPSNLAAAIEAGCCVTYTRDEDHCSSGPCPSGYCCYHVVSSGCGVDIVTCIEVSCAEGNFTTGC